MELDHVEAFLAITRSGGFARGSAALHLSQPATSRRIKLLEAELGAPLFDRLSRGVTLTEAGRAFLPHAQALLASMRDGIDAVNAVRGTGHGTVTLALVGTLASGGLTARLSRLCRAHPGPGPATADRAQRRGKRAGAARRERSEERRVGKECRALCRSRWSPYH